MSEVPDVLSLDIRTPEGFQAAIDSMPPMRFAEAVSSLTETERKKLSKTAQDLYQESRKRVASEWREVLAGLRPFNGTPQRAKPNFALALLAVAGKSAAVKDMELNVAEAMSFLPGRIYSAGPEAEQAAVRILCDRRPDWADAWLNAQLSARQWVSSLGWHSIRKLIRDGVCQRPLSERYVQLFAQMAMIEELEKQPDLLGDVWLLFQFDTRVFDGAKLESPAHPAMQARVLSAWPHRIFGLTKNGYLDRQRLHSEILGSLWKDWRPAGLSGLAKFHDLVEFTDDERASRLNDYVSHLSNPIPTIAAWAVRNLKSLTGHASFDRAAVIAGLPAVFNISTKAQPVAALSLIGTIIKSQEELLASAAGSIARALTHENTDVQEAALKLIESWQKDFAKKSQRPKKKSGKSAVPEAGSVSLAPVIAVLRDARELMSPVVRQRADELVSALNVSPGAQEAEHISESEVRPSSERAVLHSDGDDINLLVRELQTRIDALPEEICQPLQLRESLAAAKVGRPLPVINVDQVPRVLPFVEPVQPIESVEELIDSIALVLEHVSSPMEIERILDGISRFGMNYPVGFEDRAAPLLQRLHSRDQTFGSDSLRSNIYCLPTLASLLTIWLSEGKQKEIEWLTHFHRRSGRSILDQLLNHRTDEIRRRLLNGELTGPLFSLPTHEHGWIDPREFVKRLKTQQGSQFQFCRLDFTTALLRLAPEFRTDALAETDSLSDRIRSIVRYALGADAEFTDSNRHLAAEWLAAGRSRNPNADLAELKELALPEGPNLVRTGVISLRLDRIQVSDLNLYMNNTSWYRSSIPIAPELPSATAGPRLISAMLTEMVHACTDQFSGKGWIDAWRASFWPARPDIAIAHAIPVMLRRMDGAASSFDPVAPLLRTLLHSERAWPAISLYAMCLAFFCRDADAKAVASDALVEGILDGRAHPESLGQILGEFSLCSWAKLNRLMEALQSIGRVSHWAATVVAGILEALIATWQEVPRDGHLVLSLLLELLTSLQRSPGEVVVSKVSGLSGKTKAATIAARLITLRSIDDGNLHRHALLEGTRARIERAERSSNRN